MRWEGNRESDNVEDARGASAGGGLPIGGRGIGLGTVAIALVAGWIFGINPLTILGALSGGPAPVAQQAPHAPPADDRMARFVATVLADTEDVWREQFRQQGGSYRDPKLVLFRNSYPTACGYGQAAMGPFYCPGDQKVYIDLSFYETMRTRLGAPGDFAQAYVIAHEVGHHVQNLLGISAKVEALRGRVSQAQQNAATQIGDDALQRRSQGTVVPESFTHGTSAQRVAWFKRGLQTGSLQQCNTFEARQL